MLIVSPWNSQIIFRATVDIRRFLEPMKHLSRDPTLVTSCLTVGIFDNFRGYCNLECLDRCEILHTYIHIWVLILGFMKREHFLVPPPSGHLFRKSDRALKIFKIRYKRNSFQYADPLSMYFWPIRGSRALCWAVSLIPQHQCESDIVRHAE